MITEETKWLNKKIEEYKENNVEALISHLRNVLSFLKQYRNNPNSRVARGIVDSVLINESIFLDEIEMLPIKLYSEEIVINAVKRFCVGDVSKIEFHVKEYLNKL